MKFFAQSLDNISDDSVGIDKRILGSEESGLRTEIVGSLANAASIGKPVFESEAVLLRRSQNIWVLKVTPEELDSAGRKAPFLCGFDDNEIRITVDWPRAGLEEIEWFCTRIERTIDQQAWIDLENALLWAHKRPLLSRSATRMLICGAVFGLTIALIYWALSTR